MNTHIHIQQCPFCKNASLMPYMGAQFGKYQCKRCGYIGVLIIEREEKRNLPPYYRAETFYWLSKVYNRSISLITFGFEKKFRKDIFVYFPRHPKHIADLGCGTGTTSILIKERFPKAEVVGINLSPGMLEKARIKGQRKETTHQMVDSEHKKNKTSP